MEIKIGKNTAIIADDSKKALDIKAGKDFVFDEEKQELVVKNTSTGLNNKYQIAIALKGAKTVTELREIIIKMLDLIV